MLPEGSPVVNNSPVIKEAFAGPLFGFTAFNQFIVYRVIPSKIPGGKPEKKPCSYKTGGTHDPHDAAVWTDSATAQATAAAWGPEYGVGFVFADSDPFWFLDIDGCLVDGAWSPLALSLCTLFNGCAIEISQSGAGLHIFGMGTPPAHGCRNQALGLELYHSKRFVALTGAGVMGNCLTDASAVLPALVAQYFPPDQVTTGETGWSDGPVPEWRGPADDAELIRRAMNSRSNAGAFSGKACFADLWLANEDALGKSYPDAKGRPYDASAADAALAAHLAFWTGKDAERIERLMRQSGLVRDKWDSHKTYLRERTIQGAVARQSDVLIDKVPEPTARGASGTCRCRRGGDGFLNPDHQLTHFKGCVYIQNQHRVLVPGGDILKPEVFKGLYGGFTFVLDSRNDKTTRDAFEALMQSQVNDPVITFGVCFKPLLPPGEILAHNGQRFVNTYYPVNVDRKQGDASPFLEHLAKVLPVERDREIMLAYMAAVVQHQGIKFQWAPLLQGVEGNGKSTFSECVQEAVGARYTHWPKAKELGNKFNSWMLGKVFYAVEDIYSPDAKNEIMEALKPMITGKRIEIEKKGVDQFAADVCGNFIFNSNHRDAIRKTETDRRFCILFTAQQKFEDLVRDGMHPDGVYFSKLRGWLEDGGFAIVNELLHTYKIPAQFNPAGDCNRAPVTSTSHEAIAASLGGVEQDILEAVAEGQQGFCGGWISSKYAGELPKAQKLTSQKIHQILEGLGYVLHPGLKNGGRVDHPVAPDRSRSKLYIHRTNVMLAQITSPAAIAKSYETANQFVAVNSAFAGGNYGN